mgnify:CR=1 FL=1
MTVQASLSQLANAIAKGFDGLSEGTDALSDGMKEFDKEGIQELKKLAGDEPGKYHHPCPCSEKSR